LAPAEARGAACADHEDVGVGVGCRSDDRLRWVPGDELQRRGDAVSSPGELARVTQHGAPRECESIEECRLLDEPLRPPAAQLTETALKRRIARGRNLAD
jgi:hypothetical protein